MPQHTSGPWQSLHEWDLNGVCTIVGNIDGPDEGHYRSTTVCDVNEVPDEYLANARLIAAAPDMLDACRALVAWDDAEKAGPDYGTLTRDTHPDGEKIWRDWWDNQLRMCSRVFALARAAIAKSEGR